MQPDVENTASNKPAFKILAVILLVLLFIAAGYYFLSKKGIEVKPPAKEAGVIALVGEEKIYQADLDIELAAQGAVDTQDITLQHKMFKKLAADSIIIQQGLRDKIVTVDESVYNSPKKDYQKRFNLVRQIREKVSNMSNQTSGVVYSIWFWNTKPGPLGVDKGKQFALEKITRVQKLLKEKKIDASGAGEMIKNDTSLSQVDSAYKTNAIFSFTKRGRPVTQSNELDKVIDNLKEDEVSDIVLGKLTNSQTGKETENYYAFAYVSKKIQNSSFNSFNDWFEKNQKNYAIKDL